MQRSVLEYLEAAAEKWPDKPAFRDGIEITRFCWLRDLARHVGGALSGFGKNRPVAVLAQRNIDSVFALLGVLYSGNFYVPLDAAMPEARLRGILEALRPAAILSQEGGLYGDIAPSLSFAEAASEEQPLAGMPDVLDVDPAYMIYTSGSTGVPKGIAVSHRSVIDFTDWFVSETGIDEYDVLGNQAPLFFDLSVKDLYTTLKTGAETVFLAKDDFLFPVLLMMELQEKRVSVLNWSTAAFHMTAASGVLEKYTPGRLRLATVGGEALMASPLRRWRQAAPRAVFYQLYGPTEVTVDCCFYRVDREFADGEPIPIGKAIPNKEVVLLREDGSLAAPGETGELCVRGTGLALGYWDDPEKTAAAFAPDPRNPHYPDRLYRTGDLARAGEDGLLYFLSRRDGQIKHLGYRIELGEVETAVCAEAGVSAAACLFDAEKDRIVCFYAGDVPHRELSVRLGKRLPRYMIPNICRQLEALPLTAGGKLDRQALRREYYGQD